MYVCIYIYIYINVSKMHYFKSVSAVNVHFFQKNTHKVGSESLASYLKGF